MRVIEGTTDSTGGLLHKVGSVTQTVTESDQSVTDVTVTASVTISGRVSVGTYYRPRREPHLLNWGPWMNSDQLKQAGLKANRVPIPGDADYVGVCEQVDGVWRVKATA